MNETGLTVIQARGSFRAVGRAVGEATREDILFMRHVMVPQMLEEAFGGDELHMARDARKHFRVTEGFWPEAGEYVRGLAEGAGLGLDALLPIVFLEEMSVPLRRDRCSTLLVRTGEGWLVGHQEDYREIFYGRLSVLDLAFDGHPRLVCLCYPGTFPGMATSLNSEGVAMACNALWLAPVPGTGKQAKHFLAALERTFIGALRWICNGPHVLADHFLVIGGKEGYAASLEVTSRPEARRGEEFREIVWDRSETGDSSVSAPFTHANHVKWLEPWANGHLRDPAHHGSLMRQAKLDRIASTDPPTTPGGMLSLFRRKDGILHRDGACNRTGQPDSVSIATTVIRPGTSEIWFVGYGAGKGIPKRIVL